MEGEGVWMCGEREIIYLALHCPQQNEPCVKMDSDERHFNVSFITVRGKVARQCLKTRDRGREREREMTETHRETERDDRER